MKRKQKKTLLDLNQHFVPFIMAVKDVLLSSRDESDAPDKYDFEGYAIAYNEGYEQGVKDFANSLSETMRLALAGENAFNRGPANEDED